MHGTPQRATLAHSPQSAVARPACARQRSPPCRSLCRQPPRRSLCPSCLAALWPWAARLRMPQAARVARAREDAQGPLRALLQHAPVLPVQHASLCSPRCELAPRRLCAPRRALRWRSARPWRRALRSREGCDPQGQGRRAGLARCQAPGAHARPATAAGPPGPPRCTGTPTNHLAARMM